MRKWIALFVVLILGWAAAPPADAYKGQVAVAFSAETPTMDPHPSSNFIGPVLWRFAYDTLVSSETGTGKIVPWLAERWKVHNPQEVEFWLRKGVKFADGTLVTCGAVKFSMARVMDAKSQQRVFFRQFDRIEIIDGHDFIWNSKAPDNGLLHRITRYGLIMSPEAKGMDEAALSRKTFGSGPYILKEWTKGLRLVFEANPTWWGNALCPGRPKTVIGRSIQESTTRVKALLKSELDIIRGVPPQFVPRIKEKAGLEVASIPAVRIMYLTFAIRHGGPFANQKVRLAANYAIDAEKLRRTFLGGRGDLWGSLFHPWNYAGYNPKDTWNGYDLIRGKALMKEAGYPSVFKAELFSTDGRYLADRKACEAISGIPKEIKIDTTCRSIPYPLLVKVRKGYQEGKATNPAIFLQAYGNPAGDPANTSRATSTCKGHASHHCLKEVEEAVERAATTADPEEQHMRFQEVTALQKKLALFKVLYEFHDVYGYRKDIGFKLRGDETLFPWEISMK